MSEARRRRLLGGGGSKPLGGLDEDEAIMMSGPLGRKPSSSTPKNWKTAMLACGSNAFSQNTDGLDIMSSKLAHIQIPISKAVQDPRYLAPEQISCGSTVSACVTKGGDAYMWGTGFGSQLRIPTLLPVRQISCGATHIGLITNDGKCYTWGNGENGMLGHGHKQSINTPTVVSAFAGQECVHISCSSYHTAVIADRRIQFVRVPMSPTKQPEHALPRSQSTSNTDSFSSVAASYAGESYLQRKSDRYSDAILHPESSSRDGSAEARRPVTPSQKAIDGGANGGETLMCGSLYTFGLGKAGQLGQGDLCQSSTVPLLVATFNETGMSVCRVSCGIHHTLVVALAAYNPRVFSPVVYAFGWGEHGRLGLGSESQVNVPTQVNFPAPFHPTAISAGEQHSLAAGRQGCYAWGSNSFGQCGAGNPNSTPMCLVPTKVPIPDGIQVSKIAAGGRHSAAVSSCGKLMTWGWGEEGQLGHGNEKNGHLPRPCKLPRVASSICVPTDVALGLCHTLVLVRNKTYDYADDVAPIEKIEPKLIPSSPREAIRPVSPGPIQAPPVVPTPSPPRSPSPIEIRRPQLKTPVKAEEVVVVEIKTPVMRTPQPTKTPAKTPMEVVMSLSDLLNQREERRERNEDLTDVLKRYSTDDIVLPPLTPIDVRAPSPPKVLPEPVIEEEEQPADPDSNLEATTKKPPKVYDFDPKLNTAYRAEVRRLRKLAKEEAEASAAATSTSGKSRSAITGPSPPLSARRNSGESAGNPGTGPL